MTDPATGIKHSVNKASFPCLSSMHISNSLNSDIEYALLLSQNQNHHWIINPRRERYTLLALTCPQKIKSVLARELITSHVSSLQSLTSLKQQWHRVLCQTLYLLQGPSALPLPPSKLCMSTTSIASDPCLSHNQLATMPEDFLPPHSVGSRQ